MKNRTSMLLTLTAVTAIALAACAAQEPAPALAGRTWVLQSYGQQDDPQGVIEGTEVTATFDSGEGQVTGSAGCNHYFGSYELKGSELSIGPLASTEMWCESPEGVMDQEMAYLAALGAAETAEVQGAELRIFSSGGQVLLFNAQ
jgi:heat shock protein HslJ